MELVKYLTGGVTSCFRARGMQPSIERVIGKELTTRTNSPALTRSPTRGRDVISSFTTLHFFSRGRWKSRGREIRVS